MGFPNCHGEDFKLHTKNKSECFYFNKIDDCVGKSSSTAANHDHATANSQLSSWFDSALTFGFRNFTCTFLKKSSQPVSRVSQLSLKPFFHLANLFARTDKKVGTVFRQPILSITLPDSCFRFASREQSRQAENGLETVKWRKKWNLTTNFIARRDVVSCVICLARKLNITRRKRI